MADIIATYFGGAFFIVTILYIAVSLIFFYRYLKVRLWITYLRGWVPFLFSLTCMAIGFSIFATTPEDALFWTRMIVVAFNAAVALNIFYLTIVIYGHLHGVIGATVLFLTGIIFAQMFLPDRFVVTFSPAMQAFYPVLSFRFFVNILILGILHMVLDARANITILRRPDVSWTSKRKFVFFTCGSYFIYVPVAGGTLFSILWQDGVWLYTSIVGYIIGLAFVIAGLFYANPSVFFLPVRIYLLVVFDTAGNVLYEKSFDPIPPSGTHLIPPALFSIAKVVGRAFQQSKRLRLFSLATRQLIYEWRGDSCAVLIADTDSRVFRNCLQLLLGRVDLLPDAREKFEALVDKVFAFYVQELRARRDAQAPVSDPIT